MSEAEWLTVEEVVGFERISRMEVYSRMRPGDPQHLLWKAREDGKPGRLVNARSMTFDAQARWRARLLETVEGPKVESASGQLSLLPRADIDDQIAALKLSQSERDVVLRRYRIVDLCLNSNWKAQGYSSKGEFLTALAERNKTSARSIQRWVWAYSQNHRLEDLASEIPGPLRGTGSILDSDMKAHLQGCYLLDKLKPSQCYRSLINYLEDKQNSVGCRVDHLYPIPSRPTVERFLRSLDPIDHAARNGADALKAACGHIDRTYRSVHSLERVDTDEWITDALAYDPHKASRVGRYYLLTLLDERSIYPLVWSLVENPNEEDEINLLCRLVREFGVPGLINSDRGRFRGRTFGGRFLDRERADMYPQRDGILDRMNVGRNGPRDKHNPQGNRLERFHLELANWARTVPGWCGCDTKQRRMTDAEQRVKQHKEWIRTGQGTPPLLSRDQLLERIDQFMAEYRQRPSDGNDMDGFAPQAVFQQNAPEGGFRRLSDAELTWLTAERFQVVIGKGGIIQLRDGKRYSSPQLLPIIGERREVARARHDHGQISVLAAAKGEEAIIAKRRVRVGVDDPDELSRQSELQARLCKLTGAMVKPLEYDPSAQFPEVKSEPPKSADVIHPSEFIAAQQPPPVEHPEVSSVEYLMESSRYKSRMRRPMTFADLEY
jgi:hypothetical protein